MVAAAQPRARHRRPADRRADAVPHRRRASTRFAPNPDAEWRRLAHKVEAGAEFLVTPPVLDLDGVRRGLAAADVRPACPSLAGVAALESVRQAEFLASEVVGVRVADALLDRLRSAERPADEALAATVEIARWLRDRVEGVQMTSLHGSPETAERVLTELGAARARPDRGVTARHG